MRVLITGNQGNIGRALTNAMRDAGYDLRTFDRAARSSADQTDHHPGDVRDIRDVRRAVDRVDAVVHLAAVAHDRYGTAEDLFTTNVVGTWNVLTACAEAGIARVVFFSSVNALGNFQGHRTTTQFPIDDAYPRHPISTYQLSKHLGEEMCRSFTDRIGMTTICLRPVYVADPKLYAGWSTDSGSREPRYRSDYWSYVDIRDVCEAARLALEVEGIAHDALLLAARDTLLDDSTADLVNRYYPDVPWPSISQSEYLAAEPCRSLVDCSYAEQMLGWRPVHSWREADYESVGGDS